MYIYQAYDNSTIYSHLYDITYHETTRISIPKSFEGWQTFACYLTNDYTASPHKNTHYFTFYNTTGDLQTVELADHGTGSGLLITQGSFGKMMTSPPQYNLVGVLSLVCFDNQETRCYTGNSRRDALLADKFVLFSNYWNLVQGSSYNGLQTVNL